jgi:6-phosphogluconolactonase (cycloisomerase 2 family)
MHRSRLHSLGKHALIALPIILLLLDAALVLWAIWAIYFVSVSPLHYVALVWGAFAAAIALVPAATGAYRIVRTVLSGKISEREPVSIDHLILVFVDTVRRTLSRPSISIPAIVLLALIPPALLFYFLPDKSVLASSSVLVIPRGDDKVIYIADPDNGQILVFLSSALAQPPAIVPIGTHGNQPGKGRPETMIELRRSEKVHLIFVADTASDTVRIIDVTKNNAVNPYSLPVGRAPRALAITPDLKKLFVSNEQPIPNGTISVFDISSDKPEEFHSVSTIEKVKCPEGLSVSPNGRHLYVATQCSGGEDAVLIIDTATNVVEEEIRGLAVGTSVTVSANGRQIYVGRGNYPCVRADPNEPGSPFSIVNLISKKTSTFCLRTSVGAIALSRDVGHRYLFVANGNRLTVFDTEKLSDERKLEALLTDPSPYLSDISLEASVAGMAIADDNSVYAFLPVSRRLFIYTPPAPR